MYQDTGVCLYCKAPLKIVADRKKKQLRLVVQLAVIAALATWAFLTFRDTFRLGSSDTPKSSVVRPPQQPNAPLPVAQEEETHHTGIVQGSPEGAFRDLLSAVERSDAATARKYVMKGKLKSYQSDQEMLSDLNALSVSDAKIVKSKTKEGKAVLVIHGGAEGITDASGKTAPVIGTIKMIAQDGGWKLFSQMWDINPPNDPVPDAMSWLDSEQSGSKSQQAARTTLQERGIEYNADNFQSAVARGQPDLVKLFLAAGMSPNVKMANDETMTMFQLALLSLQGKTPQFSEIVKDMVRAGADLNARTPTRMTPLMQAALACQTEVVKSMIQAGADVNAKDHLGNTARVYAQSCPGLDQILIRAGVK